MARFIGREKELERLKLLLKKRVASLVVIRGRRRIGKSRLIEEFGADLPCHILAGLPPSKKGLTKQIQLDEFCAQVSESFDLPKFYVKDWGEAFKLLARQCAKGRVVVALDEISWMGSKDPRFLAHLKNAWDRYFSKNSELILIVCGPVSSWIEVNILSNTGFVGRISLDMKLQELPITDAVQFWDGYTDRVSPYEIFKILSVTGGVPRYLEEIVPELTAEENIRRLCFHQEGLLFREFDQIFSDLFSARGPVYGSLLESLARQPQTFAGIKELLGIERDASVSQYLKDLAQAGFISEDATWNLQTVRTSTLRNYRLSDNYMRFYLRYVKPQKESIEQGRFEYAPLTSFPGWDAIMGLQFENLIVSNVPALLKAIHLNPADTLRYGPFFQRQTARTKGCQIDLLIQARYRCLFLCEIKFSPEKIGMEVIEQIQAKQQRISVPRGWSTRLVLIHVNGVTRDLEQSAALDHIVNVSELIHKK